MTRGADNGPRAGSLSIYRPLADELPWRADAACDGTPTDPWFDEDRVPWCRTICAACPVCAACLDYALEHPQLVGVWGGTTEAERRRLRQHRCAANGVDPQLRGPVQCLEHQFARPNGMEDSQ
ncbi:MAG: WhiB family transcriptional regulator [Acidimicrobiia bacterium]